MENLFELKLDKMITKLAGNILGKKIFEEQVKDKIDYKNDIIIIIPDRIDTIASSFIQGFFEDFVSNIGIRGIEKNVEIKSSIPNIKELVIQNLL